MDAMDLNQVVSQHCSVSDDTKKIFKVETTEIESITGHHSVQVTFQLPYHCWCKLSKKKFWKKVQKFLLEEERKVRTMEKVNDKVRNVICAMEGITYLDWQKIKHVIDAEFESQTNIVRNRIQITSPENVMDAYKRLF